ncbi:MAG TPA: zf-HC2 domain-containing protein [Gemmatimonadota bacterium]|nr:zf-HC2 domain-containing protein [Gemmatimonadota bacterium]
MSGANGRASVTGGNPSGHPDEGALLAYLDGEAPPSAREEVERHLGACRFCEARLADLRRASDQLAEGLAMLEADGRVPAIGPGGPGGRRGTGAGPAGVAAGRSGPAGRTGFGAATRRAPAWAAVLVLLLTAGAVAALPGSPVRSWVEDALGRIAGRADAAVATAAGPDAAAAGEAPAPEVSVRPAAGEVTVRLRGLAPGTLVRVSLADADEARVRAPGASFRAGDGFVDVSGGTGAPVTVELPRSVASASVELGGRPAVVKRGGELRVLASRSDTAGGTIELRAGGP